MTQRFHASLQLVFSCPLSSGLHARPASRLAEAANDFSSDCTLTNLRNGLVANGKSVLGIIAADIRHNDRCALQVSGPDERTAHAALSKFVEDTLPRCDVPVAGIPEARGNDTPPRPLRAANVTCIFGAPISRGIGRGKVVTMRKMTRPNHLGTEVGSDAQQELKKIQEAIAAVRQRIGEKLQYSLTPDGAAVLQADLAMASDVVLREKLKEQILSGKSAAGAVVETGEFFVDLLGNSENECVRQRSADVEEICLQLLEEMSGIAPAPAVELSEPSVVVSETLAPQQLLGIDRRWLKALVLEQSAATSHAAILARSLGIPMLAGVRNARLLLTPGLEVVVDANRGFVVPQCSPVVRRFYEREQQTLQLRKQAWSRRADGSAAVDNPRLEVAANASSGEELILACENGADGIGLFRTEMLFLGRDQAPSEEEQFAVYSEAARAAAGRPVIIRTFDIGGDKKLPYLHLPHEENPFLGCRGARTYAEHRDLLQGQLRAILRASLAGCIQIMVPMISSLEEVVQFKAEVAQAKQQLARDGIAFRPDVQIGLMIEVPSAVFALEELCAEVDFFSIGTNDLAQYFFAADRSNPQIAPAFTVRHPAFLRFLKLVVIDIHRAGKWVGMCGEMAADLRNLPLLLGLGLDEISVPAAEVLECRRAIAKWHTSECTAILASAIACKETREVENLLPTHPSQCGEPLLSEDLVLLGSTSQTKEEVIQEMVDALYVSSRTEDRNLLEEALWAREADYSTGVGHGFATPHCKTDAVSADSICVLRLNEPVNWGSTHGERVSVVILLTLRNSEFANTNHMQIFSTLARKLMNDDFRQHLLHVQTAGQVTDYLAQQLGIPLTEIHGKSVP